MKSLIINADDVGLSSAINEAVKSCLVSKAITDVSLMPCGKSFKEACAMLRDLKKTEVGVHLTLTGNFTPCTKDLSKIKSLIQDKSTFAASYKLFVLRYLLGRISLFETYFELHNQVQKVIDEGFKVTRLDSHEHIHIFSKMFNITVKLAQEFEIPYIRLPDESFIVIRKEFRIKDLLRQIALKTLIPRARRILFSKHIKSNDSFWGHFHSGRINDDILSFIMKNLKDGINEIAVHPGVMSQELIKDSPWHKNAPVELSALLKRGRFSLS